MRLYSVYVIVFITSLLCSCQSKKTQILYSENASNRVLHGVELIKKKLVDEGYQVNTGNLQEVDPEVLSIVVGESTDSSFADYINTQGISFDVKPGKEGFNLIRQGNLVVVNGADASGALYGCIDLKNQIKDCQLPEKINITDQPEMVMRGTCIGLQKTEYLPGRYVYEYPYTEENFSWFYDKELWVKYLDMMVENRYNSLYLWNGHPFASLVKLDDYPYAVEVDDETFQKNKEIFAFLTEEADKRGIWVIQMFYNIIVSKPFAEHHGIKTQERSRPIIPVVADYTRKSIAAFIENYPNVGLLVTLGEAMHTIDDDVEWFTETIIPGVKDGLAALNITEEPPIVLRGHDTDAKRVMDAALPIYKNLYTTFKYNGESLTTYEPRDSWESIPKALSELGSVHISNVHILANLEPFRYGSPDFIQKSVQAMHTVQGANGLHLYPQASYWDWPWSADKADERLLEIERDWIWYDAWGRYAWNSARERSEEVDFWSEELDNFYGSSEGGSILKAYDEIGEIAPKLLRAFGISDGNRQTLLLGMFMGQLVNPYKYRVYTSFESSSGPVKERLLVYAEKEWKGEEHVGETPPMIVQQVVEHGIAAKEAIEEASKSVTKNSEEFERLKNDVFCYDAFANFFSEKVKAAMLVLNYKYSNDINDLKLAIPHLEKSVAYYEDLVRLTKETYLYANSMQTQQRRIPITGADGGNKTWLELLPHYQTELDNFKRNIQMLESSGDKESIVKKNQVLEPVDVTILNKGLKRYSLNAGQSVYVDNKAKIAEVTDELKKLSGVQFSENEQRENGTILRFITEQPVKILVGYFNANSYTVLNPPTLETNALANDRGQADIKIANAINITGLYPVNVYTYLYETGEHELVLGKGRVLILGFIDGNTVIPVHDAGITESEDEPAVDWLFY